MEELFLSTGVIIIDDIVLPSGEKIMGVLGGGAVHAVMAMRIWADRVGLLAPVPGNFSAEQFPELYSLFDLTGLKRGALREMARGWQYIDLAGERSEVTQTDYQEMFRQIPTGKDLPAHFTTISGIHLHCPPDEVPGWSQMLRARGCHAILWEPFEKFCVAENLEKFLEYASLVDFVSPNLGEASALTGEMTSDAIADFLHARGLGRLLLRLGSEGCLVMGADGQKKHVPAFPCEKVVDPTGAGNACCAGFVVGWHRSRNLRTAACYANVSASFSLRQFGALYPIEGVRELAADRLEWYQRNIGD